MRVDASGEGRLIWSLAFHVLVALFGCRQLEGTHYSTHQTPGIAWVPF